MRPLNLSFARDHIRVREPPYVCNYPIEMDFGKAIITRTAGSSPALIPSF